MTHILIPIEDFQNLLNSYQKEIKEAVQAQDKTKFTKFVGKHFGLKRVYDLGKLISLDEKNIESKATKYTSNIKENLLLNELVGRKRGYKQALKDLLL